MQPPHSLWDPLWRSNLFLVYKKDEREKNVWVSEPEREQITSEPKHFPCRPRKVGRSPTSKEERSRLELEGQDQLQLLWKIWSKCCLRYFLWMEAGVNGWMNCFFFLVFLTPLLRKFPYVFSRWKTVTVWHEQIFSEHSTCLYFLKFASNSVILLIFAKSA